MIRLFADQLFDDHVIKVVRAILLSLCIPLGFLELYICDQPSVYYVIYFLISRIRIAMPVASLCHQGDYPLNSVDNFHIVFDSHPKRSLATNPHKNPQ